MSSTNKTTNLNLHSWVRTDPVVCEDFNDNFNKLDEAVGSLTASRGNCEIYSGSYAGTGSKVHSLTFPKLPTFLFMGWGVGSASIGVYPGFVFDQFTFSGPSSSSAYDVMSINGTTVTFNENGSSSSSVVFNSPAHTYYYVALAPAQ